jgi:hypothetical protein
MTKTGNNTAIIAMLSGLLPHFTHLIRPSTKGARVTMPFQTTKSLHAAPWFLGFSGSYQS